MLIDSIYTNELGKDPVKIQNNVSEKEFLNKFEDNPQINASILMKSIHEQLNNINSNQNSSFTSKNIDPGKKEIVRVIRN